MSGTMLSHSLSHCVRPEQTIMSALVVDVLTLADIGSVILGRVIDGIK